MKTVHYSHKQPIWQLILLFITTFGLYNLYWFYRNWKELYPHNNIEVRPFLRTIGLFVPVVNVLLIWQQFSNIQKFTQEKGVSAFKHPGILAITFYILGFISNGLSCAPTPPAVFFFLLLFPFAVIPLIIVQTTLNCYWVKEQPTLPVRNKLFWSEIAISCIGAFLIFIFLSFIASNI